MSLQGLAEQGKTVALAWISQAEAALQGYEYCLAHGITTAPSLPMITAALRAHFKLVSAGSTPAVHEAVVSTIALAAVKRNFREVKDVLHLHTKYFRYVSAATAAAAGQAGNPAYTYGGPTGKATGTINFTPAFETWGPFARGAMVLHECVHVVDAASGPPAEVYEHTPGYATQSSTLALHNASAYASFAQHVTYGKDIRYGAGNNH